MPFTGLAHQYVFAVAGAKISVYSLEPCLRAVVWLWTTGSSMIFVLYYLLAPKEFASLKLQGVAVGDGKVKDGTDASWWR